MLDIGGGTGATAAALKAAGRAGRAGLIDLRAGPTEPMLDFAYSGNIEDPALLERVVEIEGRFETIICLDVLEHLVDPWATIARLHKCLVPGGIMVASLPNVRHYTVLAPLLFLNRWQLSDAGVLDRTHLRFFVKDTAVALMTSSGLSLEAVEAAKPIDFRTRFFNAVTLNLFRSFTALQYLVRVRRQD